MHSRIVLCVGKHNVRVLEVVTNIHVGGIERWLLDVAARADRERIQLDFACRTILDEPRQRLSALGCKIHVIPDLLHPYRGLKALRALVSRHGPYDAIHTHLHHMAGLVLWMARWSGFQIRVAHSHLDSRPIERNAGRRFLARNAMLATLIQRYATAGLACGSDAAASLYGSRWREDPRWRVLLYGIDLTPFRASGDGAAVRRDCGIPLDAFVVGNIARFAAQKNHLFFVDVAAELVRRQPATHFLLLGDGPLRGAIEARIADAGLSSRFHIVTDRTDVAAFTPAMDLFLFPSAYEGLGLALVEAQASGLPCVFTDSLPAEVNVVPALVRRMPLTASAASWADVILAERAAAVPNQAEALAAVERSPFNIATSSRELHAFYAHEIARQPRTYRRRTRVMSAVLL